MRSWIGYGVDVYADTAVSGRFLLGTIFFSGLWWTIRKGLASHRPGFWFVGSLLLRDGLVVTGFHLLLTLPGSGWKTLVASLLGFIIARLVAARLVLLQNHQ